MNKEKQLRWQKRVAALDEVMVKRFGRKLKKGDVIVFESPDEFYACKVAKLYDDYFNYPVIGTDAFHVTASELRSKYWKLVSWPASKYRKIHAKIVKELDLD